MRNALVVLAVASAAFAALPPGQTYAQANERVRFAAGATSARLPGRIVGDSYRDYLVNARAGPTMSVKLQTAHTATYFNVLPPGSSDEAIIIGSTEGNRFAGQLSLGGDYRIRFYMMRSAARRNESADYTLTVSVTQAGSGAGTAMRPFASTISMAWTRSRD